MRISCTKDDLLQRLQVVSRGVSQRSSVQILSGVLIDAQSAEAPVLLAATDMELSVRANLLPMCTSRAASSSPAGCCSTSSGTCLAQHVELTSGEGAW